MIVMAGGLMIRFIPVVMAVLTLATSATAGIYQWKDADGKVHFTDKPPADQKAQTVDIQVSAPSRSAPESKPVPDGESTADRQKKILKVLDEDRKAKADSLKKQDEARHAEQARCANLRDRQRQHNRGGRFYSLDAKGERVYKTDDEIARERNDIEQALKNCR